MYTIGFNSRPVLQVKWKDKSGQFAMTFADAIGKFGARLSKADLQVACDRAAESFNGQLQQNFNLINYKLMDSLKSAAAAVAAIPEAKEVTAAMLTTGARHLGQYCAAPNQVRRSMRGLAAVWP